MQKYIRTTIKWACVFRKVGASFFLYVRPLVASPMVTIFYIDNQLPFAVHLNYFIN